MNAYRKDDWAEKYNDSRIWGCSSPINSILHQLKSSEYSFVLIQEELSPLPLLWYSPNTNYPIAAAAIQVPIPELSDSSLPDSNPNLVVCAIRDGSFNRL
jgi:hypothetical protein